MIEMTNKDQPRSQRSLLEEAPGISPVAIPDAETSAGRISAPVPLSCF